MHSITQKSFIFLLYKNQCYYVTKSSTILPQIQPAYAFHAIVTGRFSQYNFIKVDNWLSDNLKDIGGRAVLVIYKDGKLVYTKGGTMQFFYVVSS